LTCTILLNISKDHWLEIHLDDGDSKDLRNIGKTAYIALPSPRNTIQIPKKILLKKVLSYIYVAYISAIITCHIIIC
jgi:hypothetical protein